jgi:sulfur-oxidizing protein SoxA
MRLLAPGLALGLVLGLLASPAPAQGPRPEERLSGYATMGPEAQAMQRDDFANPAMLSVTMGDMAWSREPGNGKPACAGCHGEIQAGMRGVETRYPAQQGTAGAVLDLAGRIQTCQSQHQSLVPDPRESPALLALQAAIALQSRGMPIEPPSKRGLSEGIRRGEALYRLRLGQLNLSCAQCHDAHWGKSLAGTRIPQGHPTGYPIFRMEWQSIGSLQRRLRNCLTGVRAEPFTYGAAELIDLEIYLRERAAGMASDAPGVRP